MNFLEYVFKLLWQFLSFEPGRFETLKEKAMKWRLEQEEISGKAKTPEAEKKLKWFQKLIKYDNEWYVQIGLAIFFLFSVKTVRTWLLSDGNDSDDDDDYDDDDDDADADSRIKRKLSGLKDAIPNIRF
jgi:hypothetical protein